MIMLTLRHVCDMCALDEFVVGAETCCFKGPWDGYGKDAALQIRRAVAREMLVDDGSGNEVLLGSHEFGYFADS
jgi:hypothetical protein